MARPAEPNKMPLLLRSGVRLACTDSRTDLPTGLPSTACGVFGELASLMLAKISFQDLEGPPVCSATPSNSGTADHFDQDIA